MMKKCISLLIVLFLLGTPLIPATGNAADSSDLTAQQKYDALKEKGIFDGFEEGNLGSDNTMNRAQFARVAALILGLDGIGNPDTKVVTEKPFSDVELGKWYTEEIAAAKEAGIFVGNSDGTFNPGGDLTVEQLAVVVARVLDIKPVEGAEVEGANDWAAGYIQAVLDQGISLPTNYTEPATRSQLAEVTYTTDTIVTEKKEAEKIETEKNDAESKKDEDKQQEDKEQSWYPPLPPVVATVETPTAFPTGGIVLTGTQVTLTSATESASIYYTTDLSEPTTASTLYTGPITITNSTTIKAIAVKSGWNNSAVVSFSYTVSAPIILPETIESTSQLIVGQAYTGNVTATGGTGTITYDVTNGQLPLGLDLDEYTGEISGTLNASGIYSFTVTATDSATPPTTATKQYTMSVDLPPTPNLTHLTSSPANVTLSLGDTETLTVIANYDDNTSSVVSSDVQYSSNNESVATVDEDGVVTAVADGNAIIVVTYEGVTLNVPVKVTSISQPDFIIAWLTSNPMRVGEETDLFVQALYDDISIVPEYVTELATIEIVDQSYVTIDANFKVTAHKVGTTTINVTFLSKTFTIVVDILPIIIAD